MRHTNTKPTNPTNQHGHQYENTNTNKSIRKNNCEGQIQNQYDTRHDTQYEKGNDHINTNVDMQAIDAKHTTTDKCKQECETRMRKPVRKTDMEQSIRKT